MPALEQTGAGAATAQRELGVSTLYALRPLQLLVGIVLFLALLLRHRELAILSATILVFGSGIRLWSAASRRALAGSLSVDKLRAFPGERITLEVRVENRKLLPIWLHLRIPVSPPLASAGPTEELTGQGGLLWYQVGRFRWELPARARGVHRLGPAHLFPGDFFDFLPGREEIAEGREVIVYPRVRELKPFSLPRRDFFGLAGGRSPVEDPVLILGTRDYQHGQPAKQIHWKASARHNRLQEKVLESTQHEKALLLVDAGSFAELGAGEDFERTLEAAASLAARLDRRGVSVGFATNGRLRGAGKAVVPVARAHGQLPAILEALARLEMEAERPLLDVLQHGLQLTWGLSCVHFSCRQEREGETASEYLARRNLPVTRFVSRSPAAPVEDSGVRRLEDLLPECAPP